MTTLLNIQHPATPAQRSLATGWVEDLFGLETADAPTLIAQNLPLDLSPTQVVLFTGVSGTGKSSLLRAVAPRVNAQDANSLELPPVPLMDALPGDWGTRAALLSACGLSEAKLWLRTPAELSEGQRMRFRLAFAFSQGSPAVVMDEFTATLDRPLARVLSANLRRLVTRTGTGFLAATTHDDIAEDLQPDVHVHCEGDARVTVTVTDGVKKKSAHWPGNYGCPKAPVRIGRISLGGITGGTDSGS
jgi:hypothetical protein